jgi:hypothetical protein
MKNVAMRLEGEKLIITVDLTREYGFSGSGKSIIIASTDGNISVPGNEQVRVGINVYRPHTKNSKS